jgi:hypothetical protein
MQQYWNNEHDHIGAQRQFVDESGTVWRVIEREVPVPGKSLFFESDVGWRRVRRYPNDWRNLSPQELDALSRRAP